MDLGHMLKHRPTVPVPEVLGVVFDGILKAEEETPFKLHQQTHLSYHIFLGISETREWLQKQGLCLNIW